jgi:uncharacterized protein
MTSQRTTLPWPHPLPLVGMVHLLPLPGAPGWRGSMREVLERARADAAALRDGGMDGIIVENFLDVPFYPGRLPAEAVAALTLATQTVIEVAGALPVGVNALRNDARAALGIAAATGARFIRVNVHTGALLTDQGWIQGKAHRTLRLRARLRADVAVWADVLVKHATPLPGLTVAAAARDAWERGLADVLIITGSATGQAADPERIREARRAVPEAAVWIGSGVTAENAAQLLTAADGAIVGSALMRDGRPGQPVAAERVEKLVAAVERVRSAGPR